MRQSRIVLKNVEEEKDTKFDDQLMQAVCKGK